MAPTAEVSPTCLIALKHFVVAQDIAQIVAEFDPAAQVILVTDPRSIALTEGVERVWLAFLGIGPSRVAEDPLAQAVLRRGGRLVLISDEAEETGATGDWWVLQRPFTTDAVLSLLQRASASA
ncbi:MAG: hypothetical protein V7668_05560 [Cereibacter changlensis]|uniref:Response regulatory domain-containing protein n=2 Tax=Cereibacter changlensis TaxID=402884 RepID=A0A2T4JPB9_9RHOB|nr:hypothetical protein [Cereibacter changlensis]PTE19759.1 hypothetical protein C5F48_21135 [Cereibacter changlensis JA139]PZX58909.1 hypothetical protein LX76_00414 [Cereibacter changlensis]